MANLEFKDINSYSLKTHDKDLNKRFRDEKNSLSKNYYRIGNLAAGSSFYKYFPVNNAIRCLENNTMAFVEPSRWNDAYERLYYEADYSLVSSNYQTHPRVFATCATTIKYNEPAWKIYSGDEKVCVQFEIDRAKFRYEILKSLDDGDSVYEGVVQYASKAKIKNIGKKKLINKDGSEKENPDHNLFIHRDGCSFDIVNYLNLLLLKRTDFRHEQESRFFIVKKDDVNNQAQKAIVSTTEISDSTGRRSYVNYGDIIILKNIKWINVLKGIAISVDEGHCAYKQLSEAINQMIDREIVDAKRKAELKKRLEPVPYFVYGTTPDKMLIEK